MSVIIPTYNGEKRIARTLRSIIAQDYANLEILVVDDASTDGTVDTARKVLGEGGRNFRVILRERNGGQCAARNTGLKAALGEYVMFFDHDDLADENLVSVLCSQAQARNTDAALCGFRHCYEAENRYESERFVFKDGILSAEKCLELWAARKIDLWSIWNFIFRKSFLDDNSLHFTESCYFGEDTEFILKVLACRPSMSFVSTEALTYMHYAEQQTRAAAFVRHNQDAFRQRRLSAFRTARFIARHIAIKSVRNYALNFYVPDSIIKQCTVYAQAGNREGYESFLRTLRHKKIREVLLSSVKFVLRMPEVFLKSLMLLYAPEVYYRLRKGK